MRTSRTKSIVLGIFLSLGISFAYSCEGEGGDSGGGDYTLPPPCCDISCNDYAPTSVVHGINPDTGELTWQNTSSESYFESGQDKSYTLTWYCATYEKCTGYCYVELSYWDWSGDGQGWIMENEYISDGICDDDCI